MNWLWLCDLWIYLLDLYYLMKIYIFITFYKQAVISARTRIKGVTYNISGSVEAFFKYSRVLSCYKMYTWLKYWNKLEAKKIIIITGKKICNIDLDQSLFYTMPLFVKTSEWDEIPDNDLANVLINSRYNAE